MCHSILNASGQGAARAGFRSARLSFMLHKTGNGFSVSATSKTVGMRRAA